MHSAISRCSFPRLFPIFSCNVVLQSAHSQGERLSEEACVTWRTQFRGQSSVVRLFVRTYLGSASFVATKEPGDNSRICAVSEGIVITVTGVSIVPSSPDSSFTAGYTCERHRVNGVRLHPTTTEERFGENEQARETSMTKRGSR